MKIVYTNNAASANETIKIVYTNNSINVGHDNNEPPILTVRALINKPHNSHAL